MVVIFVMLYYQAFAAADRPPPLPRLPPTAASDDAGPDGNAREIPHGNGHARAAGAVLPAEEQPIHRAHRACLSLP